MDDGIEEINFSCELRTSEDGRTITLTLEADSPMDIQDYISALEGFIEQLVSEESPQFGSTNLN